ncbi:MAG: hypothetical protein H7Z41_02890 [Cytophagales bacterium]|nr:hypothetical protein [Armatimonadota bacterium]
MAKYPRFFSETYVQAIRGGEMIGTLYLLLGLTEVENTLPARLLREAGISAEALRTYIAREPTTETAVQATD